MVQVQFPAEKEEKKREEEMKEQGKDRPLKITDNELEGRFQVRPLTWNLASSSQPVGVTPGRPILFQGSPKTIEKHRYLHYSA